MRVSANWCAKGPVIDEPMSGETPQTRQDCKHHPNYRYVKAFTRGAESSVYCDVIPAVGDRNSSHG